MTPVNNSLLPSSANTSSVKSPSAAAAAVSISSSKTPSTKTVSAPSAAAATAVSASEGASASSKTLGPRSSAKSGDLTNPKSVLGKDDFLKLLLTELKYQDPTAPMDTEKILAQTSQLATLESSNNTNKALSNLAASLSSAQQFSTIGAIGKIADLGDDTITAEGKGKPTNFDLFIPSYARNGTITITDSSGNAVDTIDVGIKPKGVHKFIWNGKDSTGKIADAGIYHANATYLDANNKTQTTKVGTYPIESVKFDGTKTLLGVGSNYVPLASIKEVY